MARLFKVKGRSDWHGSIQLGVYQHKRARFCADKDTSARWHTVLQAAVDRHGAGEPIKPDTEKDLPRRLLESFGLVSQLATIRRRGTYADNVADYKRELETAGRDATYVHNVNAYLTTVGTACRWARLANIDRGALVRYLGERRAAGTSPRTLKNIRGIVTAFCLWAVDTGRLYANPLGRPLAIDDKCDRKRQRRALTPDEVTRLLAVAGSRELLYRVALGTGLRTRELKRLQWGDVRIDNVIRPRLDLRPEATKSKRADSLPLSPALVDRLRKARPADHKPTDRVFRSVPAWQTWCRDMKRAKIQDHEGEILTVGFHSLRVTFVSELQRAGVNPRTIMELARHTDYRLTAGTYTDPRVLDTAGAVARLPQYDEPVRGAETARREGTNDEPVRADGRDCIGDKQTVSAVRFGSSECPEAVGTTAAQTIENTLDTADSAGVAGPLRIASNPMRRDSEVVEPTTLTGAHPGLGNEGGTKSMTETVHDASPADAELRAVVTAWPTLPKPIRAGILAMVRAAQTTAE